MPTPLNDVEATKINGFAGLHAFNTYLTQFHTPHPPNSRENGRLYHWLGSLVQEFQLEAKQNNVQLDIITKDDTKVSIKQDWFTTEEYWVPDSRNVIAKIVGSDEKLRDQSILINAHYDSVPTSFGVTDNGMGVTVTIELLRYFIKNPPKHTMIFLFNNMEEGGLVGAKVFVEHPWFKSVKVFLNLEGAGAGGRSMLFRSSSLLGVKKLASSKAHYLNASPLGNDMFKLNLIKSDTDYSVFDRLGVPGLDVAFYSPRSHYHTQRDSLAYTSPKSVQYMGQLSLGLLQNLDQSGSFQDDVKEQPVYYDFIGRFIIVMSFFTYQLIHILALIITPLVPIVWVLKQHPNTNHHIHTLKKEAIEFSKGFFISLSAFIAVLTSLGISTLILININPLVSYAGANLVAFYLFIAQLTGLVLSLLICQKCSWYRVSLSKNPEILLHGLNGIWWILVVLATVLGHYRISALYYAIWYLIFGTLASITFHLLPKDNKYRLPLVFAIQYIIPFILMSQNITLTLTALRHSPVDGSSALPLYVITGYEIALVVLPLLYWVQLAGNQRKVLKLLSILFAIILVICFFKSPFDSNLSPNKLLYRQEYNVTSPIAKNIVRTNQGVETLKDALTEEELKTFACESISPYTEECTYESTLLPLYARQDPYNEATISFNKTCTDDVCTIDGNFSSKNSLFCQIKFHQNHDVIEKAWINNGTPIEHESVKTIMSYSDNYDTPIPFGFSYPAQSSSPQGTFSCYYDEWYHDELPGFTSLRDRLSSKALLVIRGQGISIVHFKNLEF
ncbi:hypothetical protein BJ944DRAFT_170883 [Cunninghamella echinulata]|nr:hypothetical protein BJ944DRAFT_170883 [Cunninghamella echinulata]